MSHLDHDTSVVQVDCILTKKGREILAQGKGNFKIVKFAVADDEVDYGLWNPDAAAGSAYYGQVIENMPVLEANPDDTKCMRFKLVSLDKNQLQVSTLQVGSTSLTLNSNQSYVITPSTLPAGIDDQAGYTLILHDSSLADVSVPPAGAVEGTANTGKYTGDTTVLTYVGKTFTIVAKAQQTAQTGSITIIGNESGAVATIDLTVNAVVVNPDGTIPAAD